MGDKAKQKQIVRVGGRQKSWGKSNIIDLTLRSSRTAYEAHPERFVKKIPVPPAIPEEVWINKPKPMPMSEEKVH